VFSPLIALLAAGAVVTGQWVRWRFEVASVRASIRKDLPRLLTGARVLLDSGTANAEHALAAAVGTYADPAAELLREALRRKEVRRIDFESAVDEVADRYAVEDLHRLADNLRVGHRYGTGMSPRLVGRQPQDGQLETQALWAKLEPGGQPLQVTVTREGNLIVVTASTYAPAILPIPFPPFTRLPVQGRAVHAIEQFEPGSS